MTNVISLVPRQDAPTAPAADDDRADRTEQAPRISTVRRSRANAMTLNSEKPVGIKLPAGLHLWWAILGSNQ